MGELFLIVGGDSFFGEKHVLEDWRSFERKKEREKEQLQPRLSRYAPRCFWNSYLYLIFPCVRFLKI